MMPADADRADDALQHIDPGRPRDEWVKVGMAAKSAGVSFEAFHEWSKSAGNYKSEADCATVWKSFNGSGVTPATLFGMAIAEGWIDPAKTRHNGHNPRKAAAGTGSTHNAKEAPVRGAKHATSDNAAQVWARCVAADAADAYILRKQGTPDGLRIYPASAPPLTIKGQNVAGYLAVPCWSDEHLQTLQFIPPEKGDKLNLPGAHFGDGFFAVGDLAQSARIFIVEGIGQAWAAWKATGCAAVVTFGAGRMASVAKAMRTKYPAARVVLLPDRGKESQAAAIAADVAGEWCELPADKPSNYDANDYLQEAGADALADLLERTKAPPIICPLSVIFADELPDTFTPPDEVVEGVFVAGEGSVVYGDSGSGKTSLVVDCCCAVVRAIPWMGRKTESGLVIYLAAENPASVRRRLQAYQKFHNAKVPNFAIVQNPIDLFDSDEDADKIIQAVRQIEAKRGQRARLIVGDTLARLSAGANENSGQDMGLIVRRIDRIRAECNAHFMLIHHSGKNIAAGARGWSGVRAAIDTEIEVTDSPTGRCAEITKQRDLSTKGERIGFRLDSVTLGLTKWGAPATSCVLVPTDAPAKQAGKRMGEVEGAVVEFLGSHKVGIKKRDVVTHFDGRYEKGPIYRAMKSLVAAAVVHEAAGIVALARGVR